MKKTKIQFRFYKIIDSSKKVIYIIKLIANNLNFITTYTFIKEIEMESNNYIIIFEVYKNKLLSIKIPFIIKNLSF